MLFSESFLLPTIQFHHRFAAHNVLYNQTFPICCFLSVSFCYETAVYTSGIVLRPAIGPTIARLWSAQF